MMPAHPTRATRRMAPRGGGRTYLALDPRGKTPLRPFYAARHRHGAEAAPALPVTITLGDMRRLLAETMVQLARGEVATKEAERIARDCGRITRELNQRASAALRLARLARTEAESHELTVYLQTIASSRA